VTIKAINISTSTEWLPQKQKRAKKNTLIVLPSCKGGMFLIKKIANVSQLIQLERLASFPILQDFSPVWFFSFWLLIVFLLYTSAPCNRGTFSSSGLEPCIACPRGTYQDETGQTSCKPCTVTHEDKTAEEESDADELRPTETTAHRGSTSRGHCSRSYRRIRNSHPHCSLDCW
jgi:hypothetical protein